MTVLAITNRPLSSFASGYDLRVWHLCRVLAESEKLVLLALSLGGEEPGEGSIHPESLFAEVVCLPLPGTRRPSILRHLRLNEADFYSLGYPEFQRAAERQIGILCDRHGIDKLLVFGSNLAGLVRRFSGRKKVLFDVCDSVVLTHERQSIASAGDGFGRRLQNRLMLHRWRALEGRLTDWFDQVATINRADSLTIERLSGGARVVATIPNGIDPSLESAYSEDAAKRRGVAFWGNLAFPPNRDAVDFFYHNVYSPYLKPEGIEWCIAGRGAEDWLVEAAARDAGIRLTGFVTDLRGLLRQYPVMVNPMRIGSGMKNKVLEAFALGLAVVSTALGMESIDGAVPGRHFMAADEPRRFADDIVALLNDNDLRTHMIRSARELMLGQYTWNIVGRQWVDLFNKL